MRRVGYASKTLMDQYSVINKREDYDLLASDLVPSWVDCIAEMTSAGLNMQRYFSFLYILSLIHI